MATTPSFVDGRLPLFFGHARAHGLQEASSLKNARGAELVRLYGVVPDEIE